MTEHPLDELAAYALGVLDGDESARVAAHLASCKTCRTAFVTDEIQAGGVVECPKCGARHRLPPPTRQDPAASEPSMVTWSRQTGARTTLPAISSR